MLIRDGKIVECEELSGQPLRGSKGTTPDGRGTIMEPSDLDNSQKAVLLALANMPTNHVAERLYFEKLLFLLTKAVKEQLPDLDQSFEPYKFGMYSEYADEIVQRFDALGLAEDHELLPAGKELADQVTRDPFRRLSNSLPGSTPPTFSTPHIGYIRS
jgi:hypothetical protein